jgi:hypothetical protein
MIGRDISAEFCVFDGQFVIKILLLEYFAVAHDASARYSVFSIS